MMELIADPSVQVVDICLPATLHLPYALAAREAGKHVLVEKPLARTFAVAKRIADAAERTRGFSMPAMCMRFWPGWTWLKQVIDDKAYGSVRYAHFHRVASRHGGRFDADGQASGGAVLDLHIHDADFILWCFGVPSSYYQPGLLKHHRRDRLHRHLLPLRSGPRW
jgi:predicted dehydrogenase